jgi:hypothetical protein
MNTMCMLPFSQCIYVFIYKKTLYNITEKSEAPHNIKQDDGFIH